MKKFVALAIVAMLFAPEVGMAFYGKVDRGSMLQRLDAKGRSGELGRLQALTASRQVFFQPELTDEEIVDKTISRRTFSEKSENHSVRFESALLYNAREVAYERRRQEALDSLQLWSDFDFGFHIPTRVRTY